MDFRKICTILGIMILIFVGATIIALITNVIMYGIEAVFGKIIVTIFAGVMIICIIRYFAYELYNSYYRSD